MVADFKLEDYYYDLPASLIAQHPARERNASRLMVLNRKDLGISHCFFRDLAEYLNPGDCLILNDTSVFPARIKGRKETGGAVEFLLLHFPVLIDRNRAKVRVLCKSSKPLKIGQRVICSGSLVMLVKDIFLNGGQADAELIFKGDILEILNLHGRIPLPPYIKRDQATSDIEDYQTVYARETGSVAAPTAGLHFTQDQLEKIKGKGVDISFITLHVGYGTFAPIRSSDIREHKIHSEWLRVPQDTVGRVAAAKARGGRVVAAGTTSVRGLEAAYCEGGLMAVEGLCDLYITPGHNFKVVDAIITNFHLPKSSLLVLVSAFAGRETILKAYEQAIHAGYRFYSYGDAMFIY